MNCSRPFRTTKRLKRFSAVTGQSGFRSLGDQVTDAYQHYLRDRTFHFPTELYGPVRGNLLTCELMDSPAKGETSFLELDSARTAFLSIDMQSDFCGAGGYVDAMGYDLALTRAPIPAIQSVLRTLRQARGTPREMRVMHTREGHAPDLSDAPFNKVLRSKVIGKGVGIGDIPPGGMGRLLIRGEPNWEIIPEVRPIEGEIVIDKSGKGAFSHSNLHPILSNLGITHLVLAGVTTDVCVHTIMSREANDHGYWCLLLEDATAATHPGNHKAAIRQIKMQGGVFGWVTDSKRFIDACLAIDVTIDNVNRL